MTTWHEHEWKVVAQSNALHPWATGFYVVEWIKECSVCGLCDEQSYISRDERDSPQNARRVTL